MSSIDLRKHAAGGRIVRIRRALYAVVSPGQTAGAVEFDPYLVATKVAAAAAVSHHAALQFHGRAYSLWNRVTFFTGRSVRPFRFGATEFVPVRVPRPVADLPSMGGGIDARLEHLRPSLA